MKNSIIFIIAFVLSAVILSCSDLKEELTKPEVPGFHGEDVYNPQSPDFHGKLVANSLNKLAECQQCHAVDYTGGTANYSCATSGCHPSVNVHKEGINNPNSPDFHGKFIAANFAWDMRNCGTCHATDYSGGITSPSCLTCHTGNNGPEACNTCHGDFADPSRIAPPRALNGAITTTDPGVGAHVAHLYENDLGDNIRCSTCHRFPSSMYADTHLGNDGLAEITFGRLAIQQGVAPSYDFGDNSCANTYCHGNFTFYKDSSDYPGLYTAPTMTGNNVAVIWNIVNGSQAQCGSCHGIPPAGHQPFALNECATCHIGVIDNQGNIIDQTLHINGEPNVFGN